MSHTRKPDPAFVAAITRQARDQLIIVIVAMFAVITAAGAVGFERVNRAYEIASRV